MLEPNRGGRRIGRAAARATDSTTDRSGRIAPFGLPMREIALPPTIWQWHATNVFNFLGAEMFFARGSSRVMSIVATVRRLVECEPESIDRATSKVRRSSDRRSGLRGPGTAQGGRRAEVSADERTSRQAGGPAGEDGGKAWLSPESVSVTAPVVAAHADTGRLACSARGRPPCCCRRRSPSRRNPSRPSIATGPRPIA